MRRDDRNGRGEKHRCACSPDCEAMTYSTYARGHASKTLAYRTALANERSEGDAVRREAEALPPAPVYDERPVRVGHNSVQILSCYRHHHIATLTLYDGVKPPPPGSRTDLCPLCVAEVAERRSNERQVRHVLAPELVRNRSFFARAMIAALEEQEPDLPRANSVAEWTALEAIDAAREAEMRELERPKGAAAPSSAVEASRIRKARYLASLRRDDDGIGYR